MHVKPKHGIEQCCLITINNRVNGLKSKPKSKKNGYFTVI